MIAGTPAGISLSPEGGAHQSLKTPLIGMSQSGLASFEPAYADELAVIMAWGFDYMQRDGGNIVKDGSSSADDTGGSVYLRLSTRTIAQQTREMTADLAHGIVSGGYWMTAPASKADVVIAYTGAVAPEAIEAAKQLNANGVSTALLSVTSAGRLHSGWTSAAHQRRRKHTSKPSHIEELLATLPRDCAILTVLDGHPAALGWLGSVLGHRTTALGVEAFGESGTIADLYAIHSIDTASIVEAAQELVPPRANQKHRLKAS